MGCVELPLLGNIALVNGLAPVDGQLRSLGLENRATMDRATMENRAAMLHGLAFTR